MTMSPYILVLAKNTNEGAKYVQLAKLPRGRWRNVASASSIRGIRFATVHCLPGFHSRADKHSILAELRYAKCEWVDVEMPTPAEAPAVDQGDGMGQQLTLEDAFIANAVEAGRAKHGRALAWLAGVADAGPMTEAVEALVEQDEPTDPRGPMTIRIWDVAHRYNVLRDALIQGGINEVDLVAEAAEPIENVSADAPKRRRRSKCGSCGELHFAEESCAVTAPVVKATPVDTASIFN